MFGDSYLKDVVTLRLDVTSCNGCGRCVQVCPHAVFVIEAHKARISERDACVCRQNNSHSFSHLTMCGFGRILAYKEVNHESRTEPLPI